MKDKYLLALLAVSEIDIHLFSPSLLESLYWYLHLPSRIFTLYSKSLPLDLACRVWDVFCRDGEEFLFRTALGLLRLYHDVLTSMDFIHMAQFLTRLPDLIPAEQLFQHIASMHMTSRNRKWPQVLSRGCIITSGYQTGYVASRSGWPTLGKI